MHQTYILKLSNGEYYAGSTANVRLRVKKHEDGAVPHTSKYRPVKLVWYAGFKNRERAAMFEKYLKSSSGKAFRNKHLV